MVRRRRTPSPLLRFGLISFALVALLGVGLAVRLQHALRDRAVADAVRTAEVAVDIGVEPLLRPADLERDFVPLDEGRVADLDAALLPGLSPDSVVRVKLWNRQHWLVYSDDPRLRGRWFAGTPLLEESFAGRVVSEVTDLSSPEEREEREERDFGQLLAVYVPLRVDDATGAFTADPTGRVVGAFEIYLPYAPIATAIRADALRLYATLAVGLAVLYLALFRLVAGASSRLRRQAEEDLHQATHDELTGLPNRVRFTQLADEVIARCEEDGGTLAVALLDLDAFRVVNDTLGHASGDAVLRVVAERLVGRVRSTDAVARLGGDEFAVLLPGIGDEALARRIGTELAALLQAPIPVGGLDVDVRTSVGVVLHADTGGDAGDLLRHADVALYAAKDAHRGVEVYRRELDRFQPERLELAAEVRRAVDAGELRLHYQPKQSLADGRITGAEALIRWEHPERGLLAPAGFLPVVEATELIHEVTAWVLRTALDHLGAWRAAGLDLGVAVNLSARDLGDPGLPALVRRELARTGVPAAALELELTESAVLAHPAQARAVLEELDALGCRLAVDDFGTGYASLAYLTDLPVRVLKIDRSFVSGLHRPGKEAAIVRHSIDLGRSLRLEVVAEGVEDGATAAELARLGCHQVQGSHLSRPLPADRFEAWLRERTAGPHPGPAVEALR